MRGVTLFIVRREAGNDLLIEAKSSLDECSQARGRASVSDGGVDISMRRGNRPINPCLRRRTHTLEYRIDAIARFPRIVESFEHNRSRAFSRGCIRLSIERTIVVGGERPAQT